MKAYYYEEYGAKNGILLTDGKRWCSFIDIINGEIICRETIDRITRDFADYEFDINDFEDEFEASENKGYDVEAALKAKRYFGLIYEAA